jgi:hypothetical protein
MRTAALLGTVLLAATAGTSAARAEERTDHKAYRDSKPDECRECHGGSGVVDHHSQPGFLKGHRLLAQKASANCGDCHSQSYCVDCHSGGNGDGSARRSLSRRGEPLPSTHTADFVSTHAIVSRDDPSSCARCHEPRFCSDCHARWSARPGLSYAVRRHGPTYTAGGVPDPSWVAAHRAQARRDLKSCEACHPSKADCSNFACHPGLRGR